MKREKIAALALAFTLLAGCALPKGERPAPSGPERPAAERLTWLHGYYANNAYSQLELAGEMDAVSLGWARLRFDQSGPWVSTTRENGNDWVTPQNADEVKDFLDSRGVPYNLCVYASAGTTFTDEAGQEQNVLTTAISPAFQEETARVLVDAVEGYGGLTIDFEGLRSEESRTNFAGFMALLRRQLPADKALYVTVPPDKWYQGYDYRALGEVCDKVILMAHDYQWTRAPEENLGTPYTDTPIAPILRVSEALDHFTDPDTGVRDLSKTAMAVAFSCAGVEVDGDGLLLNTRVYNPGTAILTRRLAQPDTVRGWSEDYQAPYAFYYDDDGQRYRVWYEDERSVKAKVDLALHYGVAGLSLWRLGTVPNTEGYDVWSAVTGWVER